MEQVEITWQRALKVWWSYSWRALILIFAVMLPIEAIFMFFIVKHMPPPGQPMDPQQGMRWASTMMVLWPLLMALLIALQVAGMRWALRSARWSDFRLAVLPRE
jgi:heme/copper-type cytochrome/quinol oxidase subunit 2